MGGTILAAFVVIALFGAMALVMMLLWRRMKRVSAHVADEGRRTRVARPGIEDADGRGYDVNEDLLSQGAAARENRWHIT